MTTSFDFIWTVRATVTGKMTRKYSRTPSRQSRSSKDYTTEFSRRRFGMASRFLAGKQAVIHLNLKRLVCFKGVTALIELAVVSPGGN